MLSVFGRPLIRFCPPRYPQLPALHAISLPVLQVGLHPCEKIPAKIRLCLYALLPDRSYHYDIGMAAFRATHKND